MARLFDQGLGPASPTEAVAAVPADQRHGLGGQRCLALGQCGADGTQFGEDGHAFGKNRATRQREPILREVAGRDSSGSGDFAVVQGFQTCQNFHQGGLACAICAHQTEAVLRRDQPVHVLKQQLVPVALARA